MIYVLMISIKDGYQYHSAHTSLEVIKEWQKCKEHEGADTKILTLTKDDINDIELAG